MCDVNRTFDRSCHLKLFSLTQLGKKKKTVWLQDAIILQTDMNGLGYIKRSESCKSIGSDALYRMVMDVLFVYTYPNVMQTKICWSLGLSSREPCSPLCFSQKLAEVIEYFWWAGWLFFATYWLCHGMTSMCQTAFFTLAKVAKKTFAVGMLIHYVSN